MKNYFIGAKKTSSFGKKPAPVQRIINEALYMIERFGTPVDDLSPRVLERMALCFLALADVQAPEEWKNAKDIENDVSLRSRDIINYLNDNFGENISLGSYDDIRRRDLLRIVLNGIVIRTSPNSARNSPKRGYALSPEFAQIVRGFGSKDWEDTVDTFMEGRSTLGEALFESRSLEKVPIILPSKEEILLTLGEHNELQKHVIEEFLPRFGRGSEVYYVGDAAKKALHLEKEKLKALNFFELSHGELPDVVAYSPSENWIYLIEAVHSFGAITPERLLSLRKLTEKCTAGIIYVTAFQDRKTFRKFVSKIAWETEVWIADSPDHLIHFNGEKFQGPY